MYLGLKDLKHDVVCRSMKVYIFKYLQLPQDIHPEHLRCIFFFGEKEVLSEGY